MKLSSTQQRVLALIVEGRVEWARPVLSGGGYFCREGDGKWGRTTTVRTDTVEALIRRGLVERPPVKPGNWSAVPVKATDVGIAFQGEHSG